jgi:predicted MFS family arabinose efflux permease
MAAVDLIAAVVLLGFPRQAALSLPAGATPARLGWPICALAGLGMFALGAGGLQAFVERLSAAIGIAPQELGHALAFGAGMSILAPLLVMALGTRLGRALPIALGGAVLCLISWMLTHAAQPTLFLANAALLGPLGLLLSPYLFGVLALLDASGRLAGAGPAFLMLGVALGPALAGIAISRWGLGSIGVGGAVSFALAVVLVCAALRYAHLQALTIAAIPDPHPANSSAAGR